MAGETYLSTAAQNAAANAIVDLVDAGSGAGTFLIYDGTRPASANTAVTTQTLLATLTFSDPAFGAASSGVCTASAITEDSSADATGTASWCRIVDSDANVIFDGDVTATGGGGCVELATTTIPAGSQVDVTACTFTLNAGT